MPDQPARNHVLLEATYPAAKGLGPNVAILPWGATEAHGNHLPHGTDVVEATEIAIHSAQLATQCGARPIVLPTIPFGNDELQLDQVATISITTATALAILRDVVRSLKKQGIDRLLIVNAHGGNEFKPLIRDVIGEFGSLVVLANFYQVATYQHDPRATSKGDHADEMETSLMLHLRPEWVALRDAGLGPTNRFTLESLNTAGIWTPRPWSQSHPDTGSGDPRFATAEKGREYFDRVCAAIADVIVELSQASESSPFANR